MTKNMEAFIAGAVVGAFVFVPLGMVVMGRLCANARDVDEKAVEDRIVTAYMNGIKNARLQMAAESRGIAENAESVGRRFRGGRPA